MPDRTPAQLAALARRELARRPEPDAASSTAAALGRPLRRVDRALARFGLLYPREAALFGEAVLRAAAPTGRVACRWCLARAVATARHLPAPKVTAWTVALLGPACRHREPVSARPAPGARRSHATAAAGRRPPTATTAPAPAPARRPRAAAGRASARLGIPRTRYNVAAARRLALSASACGWE
jgi:hypothetical protein